MEINEYINDRLAEAEGIDYPAHDKDTELDQAEVAAALESE